MKQYEALHWASLFLEKHNCEPQVAELLLQHHLSLSRSQFFARMHDAIPNDILKEFQSNIKSHVQTGVPIQHLMGYELFYGRKFQVNEHVLIPRPETEELVHHVIELAEAKYSNRNIAIVDVGTGSGVIAVTLALELPKAKIYATDISQKALEVAKENARKNGAEVTFLEGNFLEPLISKQITVDMIASNPPYIAREEKGNLSRTVAKFDPAIALFAEKSGLAAYDTIIQQSKEIITENGELFFEIGYKQGQDVQLLIESHFPQYHVKIIQDMNKKDRIVCASKP